MPALLLAVASVLLVPAPTGGSGTALQGPAAWHWPLSPAAGVVRPFGPGPTPYSAGHRGVDLAGVAGQPVLAAGAGRVSYAGLLAGRGVVVVVHGALRTTYEPVSVAVRVGQPVAVGVVLGTLDAGHEGCPAAACLHWGLRREQAYLDPVRLVRAGPVRLLPLGSGTGAGSGGTPVPRPVPPGAPAPDPPAAAAPPVPGSQVPGSQVPGSQAPGRSGGGTVLGAGVAGAALLLAVRRRR